jgi:hypothetical protein
MAEKLEILKSQEMRLAYEIGGLTQDIEDIKKEIEIKNILLEAVAERIASLELNILHEVEKLR